ncbi:hypothetical protein AVEN_253411-1 [Araneus ventricosus]|uniref:Uncharacterized protein n=1 Tax=Araneus ventricosus TaxID=182803 RepID=A0A4Y2K2C7_ARAVE|nr:hypothetical protein AVEN_253411-1 [Araneus ventricosus]
MSTALRTPPNFKILTVRRMGLVAKTAADNFFTSSFAARRQKAKLSATEQNVLNLKLQKVRVEETSANYNTVNRLPHSELNGEILRRIILLHRQRTVVITVVTVTIIIIFPLASPSPYKFPSGKEKEQSGPLLIARAYGGKFPRTIMSSKRASENYEPILKCTISRAIHQPKMQSPAVQFGGEQAEEGSPCRLSCSPPPPPWSNLNFRRLKTPIEEKAKEWARGLFPFVVVVLEK